MRCAISTPPPISIGGWASPSARATAIRRSGARRTTSSSFPASIIGIARTRRHVADRRRTARGIFHSARSIAIFWRAARALPCWRWKAAARPMPMRFARRASAISSCSNSRVRPGAPTARRSSWRSRWPLRATRRRPTSASSPCRHHYPENFWNPAFADPRQHGDRRRRRRAGRRQSERPSHLSVGLHRRARAAGDLGRHHASRRRAAKSRCMTPAAFHDHFGTPPPDTAARRAARGAALCRARPRRLLSRCCEAGMVRSSRSHGPPRRRPRGRARRNAGIRAAIER